MSLLDAIDNITRDTGYPPTPEELAEVLGISTQSLHSQLLPYKRNGTVRYDENECLVLSPTASEES